jgi:hypothetical protein
MDVILRCRLQGRRRGRWPRRLFAEESLEQRRHNDVIDKPAEFWIGDGGRVHRNNSVWMGDLADAVTASAYGVVRDRSAREGDATAQV